MLNPINVDVILAEDDFHEAELALRVLRKHPLVRSAVHVDDGAELLEMVLTRLSSTDVTGETVTVVLLDLRLPKVDGVEVLHRVKSREDAARIPFFVMTSSCREADFLASYLPAADGFLLKPIEPRSFTRAIWRRLGRGGVTDPRRTARHQSSGYFVNT